MTVIWAKGQEYPNYVHNVEPSVFAAGRASSNEQFYEIDVLKYHGAKNRGTLTIDFFGIYTHLLFFVQMVPRHYTMWMDGSFFMPRHILFIQMVLVLCGCVFILAFQT